MKTHVSMCVIFLMLTLYSTYLLAFCYEAFENTTACATTTTKGRANPVGHSTDHKHISPRPWRLMSHWAGVHSNEALQSLTTANKVSAQLHIDEMHPFASSNVRRSTALNWLVKPTTSTLFLIGVDSGTSQSDKVNDFNVTKSNPFFGAKWR